MNEIKFTIHAAPISVNHAYGARGKIRFLTKAGKEYKENVMKLAKKAWKGEPYDGDVNMEIVYFFPDHRRRDISNYDKQLLDSMTRVIYKDDSQIQNLWMHKRIDEEHPRTEVRITWEKK